MQTEQTYSGTPSQQALQAAIVAYYANDPRIRAVAVFGSMGRGNWDAFSDVDCDIVIGDEVRLNVADELNRLCARLAETIGQQAMVVGDGAEAGDVVFESLLQLSVRYHTLATTNWKIVESVRVLAGKLDTATIAAAGRANQRVQVVEPRAWLNQWVRYLAGAEVAVQRRQVWGAVEMLHRARSCVMELYTSTHGGERALSYFQSSAPAPLQTRLGSMLAGYDLPAVQTALRLGLDIVEQDLGSIAGGQLELGPVQRQIVGQIRTRLGGSTDSH